MESLSDAVDMPTIVLIHGWAGHPLQYAATAEELRRLTGLRVVTPLLPSVTEHGSRWQPTSVSTATIPGCAKELEAMLPEGPVILVGHSLGGGVAIALATRLRSRVRALVLISSVGGDPRFSWRSWLDMLRGSRAESVTNASWEPQVRWAAAATVLRHPVSSTRMALMGKHADLRRRVHAIGRSGVPVTLVVPDDDLIVNTGLLARVPGVSVEHVGGNHGWPINDSAQAAEVIVSSLRRDRVLP